MVNAAAACGGGKGLGTDIEAGAEYAGRGRGMDAEFG